MKRYKTRLVRLATGALLLLLAWRGGAWLHSKLWPTVEDQIGWVQVAEWQAEAEKDLTPQNRAAVLRAAHSPDELVRGRAASALQHATEMDAGGIAWANGLLNELARDPSPMVRDRAGKAKRAWKEKA